MAIVDDGDSFIAIVEHLRERTSATVTPLDVLVALQVEVGIPFVVARDLLEYFDPQMRPIADDSLIEDRWAQIRGRPGGR